MSIRRFLIILAGLLFAGCGESEKSRLANPDTAYLPSTGGSEPNSAQPGSDYDPISYWDGDGVAGPPSIKIYLTEQRAYFYKGDELVGVSQVSAGAKVTIRRSATTRSFKRIRITHRISTESMSMPPGMSIQKDVEMGKDPKPPGAKFLGAPMPYFMRITGGVGMHEGYLPGYPASHGCIRMPGKMAEIFFTNVSVGTPVAIVD